MYVWMYVVGNNGWNNGKIDEWAVQKSLKWFFLIFKNLNYNFSLFYHEIIIYTHSFSSNYLFVIFNYFFIEYCDKMYFYSEICRLILFFVITDTYWAN